MITTSENVRIIDKAELLANMIIHSEIAEHYRRSLYKLKNDQEAQAIIQKFVKIKELYEDVRRFGKYHPDYKSITNEMREIKKKLDLNEKVAAFKKAERNLQTLLDEISVCIGRSVSEQIKVPTGNPYFERSCGGGCGTGGSCGCSMT